MGVHGNVSRETHDSHGNVVHGTQRKMFFPIAFPLSRSYNDFDLSLRADTLRKGTASSKD